MDRGIFPATAGRKMQVGLVLIAATRVHAELWIIKLKYVSKNNVSIFIRGICRCIRTYDLFKIASRANSKNVFFSESASDV